MGGEPVPSKNVKWNHISQIIMEMLCTSTQEYHHGVWTPVGTKVFLVERDDKYMPFLLNYLYKFWNLACDEIQPPWHNDVFGLKPKSKEITTKSPCASFIPNSLITPNVLSPTNLKKFQTVDKQVKQKDFPESVRIEKMKNGNVNATCARYAQQLSYQSYKYGSNGIHNSCNQ